VVQIILLSEHIFKIGTINTINLGGVLFGKNTYAINRLGHQVYLDKQQGRIGINLPLPTEALNVFGNTK
jgi:hypothetical protein